MKIRNAILLIPVLLMVSLACSVPGLDSIMATDTPVPTNTIPPTLTPQPTATTQPTEPPPPTEQPSEPNLPPADTTSDQPVAVILDNSFKIDEWDYIVGLVQNNTSSTIEWVEISVLLYDENNNVIATENAYPFLDMLEPGDTAPFSIYSDQWGNASTYDFVLNWDETDEGPAAGLEFANFTSYSDDYYFNIVGEVRNTSDQAMSWVKIAGALYDVDGMLLNANYTYSMIDYIPPGGTSPFKIWFGENWENADTYEIQVQGDYDTMPTQVVELLEHQISEDNDWCTISGSVRNTGTEEVSYATIVVGFYDASNNLLEAEWNFSDGDNIAAGATDTFEVTSYNCPDFDHYEVFIGN